MAPETEVLLIAQQQADESRLRAETARMAFLTGHFDEWLLAEFNRTKKEYDALVARRDVARPVGASPPGS